MRTMICRGAASALIACSGAAFADPEPEMPERATSLPQWVLRAQQRLALEPAQQRELRMLVNVNSERMREVSTAESADAQLEEMAELRQEFRATLADILTPEQMAEWDALVEELLGEIYRRHAPLLVNSGH